MNCTEDELTITFNIVDGKTFDQFIIANGKAFDQFEEENGCTIVRGKDGYGMVDILFHTASNKTLFMLKHKR